MCSPEAMAMAYTAAQVAQVAGTMLRARSSFQQAKAQKDQLAYQAAVTNNNAIIRERQAADTIKRGEEDARTKAAQIKTLKSRQLVTLAGQGADVTTGTSVDLLAETAELGKLEEQKIRNNAARDANSIRADVTNIRANAAAAKAASGAINPLLAAGTTMLSGLGRVGAQWYKRSNG